MTDTFEKRDIPLVNLKAQYRDISREIDQAIKDVVNETAFVRGKYVEAFEGAYASEYGVRRCISVANGTDAIYISLKMLGVGPGDEVITVANSWISTSETITQTGARPVFVDIDPDYYHIDASKIEEKITPKTKAIVPVHLYGQPCEILKIKSICEKYGLFLVEDCAQAHFAEHNGQRVGTFGNAGTFSFYPGKNLGAYGDAGAIITNDDDLASKLRMYANHGAITKHDHLIEGINSRMDGLQAAVLTAKLHHIHEWNRRRYEHGLTFNKLLADVKDIAIPKIRENGTHIFHIYAIRSQRRNELQKFLQGRGINTGIHYPVALPFMTAYKYLSHTPDDFPVAYAYQSQILSLPMYPELTVDDINYIVNAIKDFFG